MKEYWHKNEIRKFQLSNCRPMFYRFIKLGLWKAYETNWMLCYLMKQFFHHFFS